MLDQETVGVRNAGADRFGLLAGLAATQTVGYGVLYYSFAVLLDPLTEALNASAAAVTGALALGVVVTGAAAIPVGHWLDRHGGRALMTGGSILGTGAVIAWSQVHTVAQLYGVHVLIGLASAMVLYEPAFAVVVRAVRADQRSTSLLAVTIVAGFASSIFLPLTGLLVDRLGWRGALLVLAALHGLLTIPLHARLPRGARGKEQADSGDPGQVTRRAVIRSTLRDRAFWLLVITFVAHSAAVAMVAVHLVAYLVDLGHAPPLAATIAGLLGVLSVSGRVVTTALARRRSTTTVTATTFAVQAAAVATLPIVGHSVAGAVGCVVAFGLGFGVGTIARPALLAERYGTKTYGALSGTLATPVTFAKAAAPVGAAVLYTATGSYLPVMSAIAAASALAAGCLLLAGNGHIEQRLPSA